MSRSVVISRAAAEQIREILSRRGLVVQALDAAIEDEVPWHKATALLDEFRSFVDAGNVGGADQSATAIAANLAPRGADLHDERTLYAFFVALSLVHNVAANLCDEARIDHDQHSGVLITVNSIGAVLSVLAPETVGS